MANGGRECPANTVKIYTTLHLSIIKLVDLVFFLYILGLTQKGDQVMARKVQISIALDEDKLNDFRKLAEEDDRSIASMIRRMIDERLDRQRKELVDEPTH